MAGTMDPWFQKLPLVTKTSLQKHPTVETAASFHGHPSYAVTCFFQSQTSFHILDKQTAVPLMTFFEAAAFLYLWQVAFYSSVGVCSDAFGFVVYHKIPAHST